MAFFFFFPALIHSGHSFWRVWGKGGGGQAAILLVIKLSPKFACPSAERTHGGEKRKERA